MVFTQETLDLYISTALTSVSLDERKALAGDNWVAQERAIRSISRHIGLELRKRFEMVPVDEVPRSD